MREPNAIWGVLYVGFVVILLLVPLHKELAFLATRFIAPLFAFSILLKFLSSRGTRLPPELYIFGAFALWSATGLFTAQSSSLFIRYFSLIMQIFALLFIAIAIVLLTRTVRYFFFSLSILAFIIMSYSVFSREAFKSFSTTSGHQIQGVVGNSNVFGFAMLLGITGILYFWQYANSIWKKLLLATLFAYYSVGILFSGSRKSFFTLLLLVLLWSFFCYRQLVFKHFKVFLGIAVLFFLAYHTYSYAMSNLYLGARIRRIENFQNIQRLDRFDLYKEGLKIVIDHPLLGIGLGNFVMYSKTKQFAHSDIMEVCATTGIIGFSLYMLLWYLLWRRFRLLMHLELPASIQYTLHLFHAIYICMVVIGLGRTHFIEVDSMIMIGTMIGYTFLVARFAKKHPSSSFVGGTNRPRANTVHYSKEAQ